jgi:Mg2+ and Co2+ transporter CorA
MAGKSKKKKVAMNSEKLRKIGQLERMLVLTLRAVKGDSEILDEFFTNQANRIKGQIKEVKGKQ